MPTKFKSPYATTFTTGVKNGTPASTVVWNIAKKWNKPVNTIWTSLYKAGLCFRQKFNGTWVYWPSFTCKTSSKSSNTTQTNMWQSFVDWCLISGYCTPNQLSNNATTQKNFMNYCRTFFGKQFTNGASITTGVKRTTKRRTTGKRTRTTISTPTTKWSKHTRKTTRTSKTNKTWNKTKRTRSTTSTPWSSTYIRNYKFPTFKTRTTTRRYVRAA